MRCLEPWPRPQLRRANESTGLSPVRRGTNCPLSDSGRVQRSRTFAKAWRWAIVLTRRTTSCVEVPCQRRNNNVLFVVVVAVVVLGTSSCFGLVSKRQSSSNRCISSVSILNRRIFPRACTCRRCHSCDGASVADVIVANRPGAGPPPRSALHCTLAATFAIANETRLHRFHHAQTVEIGTRQVAGARTLAAGWTRGGVRHFRRCFPTRIGPKKSCGACHVNMAVTAAAQLIRCPASHDQNAKTQTPLFEEFQ